MDNCDQCGTKLQTGRLRTVGSAICANSNIGDDKTQAIYWQRKDKDAPEWYFFDTDHCRELFKMDNPKPAEPPIEYD